MPAREHVLLSDAERATLFRIPTNPDELARRFMLEKADLDLIGERRHDRNRLGMALQFALLRHPGMTLAQVLQIEGDVPGALVAFLARQPVRASIPTAAISSSRKGGCRPPISSSATPRAGDARSSSPC